MIDCRIQIITINILNKTKIMNFTDGLEEGIYNAELRELKTQVETMNAQLDELALLE